MALTAFLLGGALFPSGLSAQPREGNATTANTETEKTVGDTIEGNSPKKWGIIDFSVSHLRQAPDYESALETQELMGTVVEIVGEQGYWLQIRTPQPYTAWCTNMGVHRAGEAEIEDWISSRRYIVISPHSAIYSGRTNRSDVVCDLVEGDIVRAVLGKPQPRVRAYGLPLRKDGWAKVQTPSGKTGWVKTADVRDFYKWAFENRAKENLTEDSPTVEKAEKPGTGKVTKRRQERKHSEKAEETIGSAAVATAKRFVGTPYLWGGMSPDGFDCSGLVRFAYFMNGLMLPRNAGQMALCGRAVPVFSTPAVANGKTAPDADGEAASGAAGDRTFSADSLRAGDLLFFGRRGTDGAQDRITHVGLYIGDGRMIHASQVVRINSLVPTEADCYENAHRLLCAVRITGHENETRDDRFRADRVSNSIFYFR